MRQTAHLLACAGLITLLSACSEAGNNAVVHFSGACDASAAVALDDDLFVVANDEDNILRVYSRLRPGAPVKQFDFAAFLRPEKKAEESDLEGAAQVGDRIYWISSHSRNSKGKERESRHRFFATTASVTNGAAHLRVVGDFYSGLLDDMLADPRLAAFNLQSAAELAPKSPGALNIEGLTATPDGHLLIGFRNPIPKGRALLLPLLNPAELLEGERASFGDPMTIDLDDLGVRSLAYWRGAYLVIAGSTDGQGESRLYRWSPGQAPQRLPAPEIHGLNPEAVAFFDEKAGGDLFLLSDDGTARIGNCECKKVKDPNLRKFRAVCLRP